MSCLLNLLFNKKHPFLYSKIQNLIQAFVISLIEVCWELRRKNPFTLRAWRNSNYKMLVSLFILNPVVRAIFWQSCLTYRRMQKACIILTINWPSIANVSLVKSIHCFRNTGDIRSGWFGRGSVKVGNNLACVLVVV